MCGWEYSHQTHYPKAVIHERLEMAHSEIRYRHEAVKLCASYIIRGVAQIYES
jgi:hypothetical protein